MSPESPRFHSPETDKDEKGKKRKKHASFAAPLPVDTAEKPAERPKRSALDEVMDRLDAAKQEVAEKKAAAEEPEAGKAVAEQSPTDAARGNPEIPNETDSADEEYEALPSQEVEPNEFSGGEVIIRLQGNAPVAERVIPLRGESIGETPENHPEPSESTEAPHSPAARMEQPDLQPGTPAAAGGGELPPPPPERGAATPEPPEPERAVPIIEPPVEVLHPATAETAAVLPTIAPAAAERPATKEEVEDALHRTAKARQQRGVLSGLLVGTWFANRGLRRRQKQERAELDRQGKRLEQVTEELHAVRRTQESRHVNTEQRLHGVEKRFENPSRPERAAATRAEKPRNAEEPAEHLEVPKDHHLETSAWHTIEVDSKTGKPVENPTFSYGHEYYQERAHEAAPKDQRNAAAGEVALVAAAMGQAGTAPSPGGSLPLPDIPLATIQGVPKSTAAKPDTPAKQPSSPSSTGPLWPWLVALVVVIVCLIIAIH